MDVYGSPAPAMLKYMHDDELQRKKSGGSCEKEQNKTKTQMNQFIQVKGV